MMLQVKHDCQLCNRLFALLPAAAYAIHRKQRLIVLFQSKRYLDYFANIRENSYIKFLFSKDDQGHSWLEKAMSHFTDSPKKNIGAKFERAMLRLANKDRFVVKGELSAWAKKGLCCIDGWAHRYDESFIKEERPALLQFFAPRKDIASRVDEAFDSFDGVTVGVHVRRGDYMEYCGGRWYFDSDTYLDAIRQIKNELTVRGGNVRFLICSNESFALRNDVADMFQIKPLFPSDCMTDLYGLSRCDYIIGPPSTFSQWASYYGHVPLRFLRWKGDEIKSLFKFQFDNLLSMILEKAI